MLKRTVGATALVLVIGTAPCLAASVDKSIDIEAPAAKVWALIGPFCAIQNWHPAIGLCTETDGTRTLTVKEGRSRFVERQTDRDDKSMRYSYEIEKSPLPVSEYKSTLKVTPKGDKASSVEWMGTYTPEAGKEKDADTAIAGIYQAGLDSIHKLATK